MNVLELLLQRIRAPGGPQIFLSEEEALPSRDTWELAPGQSYGGLAAARGVGSGLHSNALGIYAGPRPPPPGDVVLPSSDRGRLSVPYLPRASGDPETRGGNVMTTPSYLPGPGGSTRIAMRGPPGAPRSDTSGLDPVVQDMIRGNLGQRLPPGLPLGVQSQIRNQPSYGEGEIMAPAEFWNPAEGGQLQMIGPQREEPLSQALNDVRNMPNTVPATPEGWGLPSRPAGQSPFASPLNQMMQWGQRAPFALY